MYWTKAQMMRHADRFSKAFSAQAYDRLMRGEIPQNELWKYSSFWYQNFDDMAKKTMLRQIISHWGIMSTEMQEAFDSDYKAMGFEGNDIVTDIDTEGEEGLSDPEQPDAP